MKCSLGEATEEGLARDPCKMGPAGQCGHSEQAKARGPNWNDFENPGLEGVNQEPAASSSQGPLKEVEGTGLLRQRESRIPWPTEVREEVQTRVHLPQ